METRFSSLEDRLVILENKNPTIASLEADLCDAQQHISTLQNENNIRDQFARMNDVEISGIPITNGENLFNILHSISAKVGLTLEDRDLDSIQRVRRLERREGAPGSTTLDSRVPAIVVKFSRRLVKDQLLSSVRARRGLTTADIGVAGPALNVYVGDHLTPGNKILLKKARKLKMDLHYAYLWVRDCKIFMRRSDKTPVIRIQSDSDLNKLNKSK
ncbi:unnamed protein product [Arctia plantaginis]|uniref:FP protein C-terminal domain-containing protein n=1 Tax=Arctia plantaginis TaxID=874455 RepID=A0A8S1B7J7_ARCPL|nr:unnamed protein product [Arctia plantaginis]